MDATKLGGVFPNFGTFVLISIMIRKNQPLLALIESLQAVADSSGTITLRNVEAGQRIIHQDVQGHRIFCVKSGVAKVFMTEENGKDYIFEFLGEGEVLGEIEAIRNLPAICTVQAITPMMLYTMPATQFLHFLRTMPHLNAVLMEQLATRVANSSIKSAKQQLYAQTEILPRLLATLNEQQINFTKQDLAEYMGISVRSLNRLLQSAGGEAPNSP